MSKRRRQAGNVPRLSDTVVPVLITVGLVAGGAFVAAPPASAANPCATQNPCNPCAAKNPCNPCNPCAAGPCSPCGPCGAAPQATSTKCTVPRLVEAAKANPCAAKNPCSPCAANPCNPCAAENPCNPCAAQNPCNPCNPCGPAAAVELTPEEAIAAYECMRPEMLSAYAKSGDASAEDYPGWRKFNTRPYVSDTHGGRYVNNYANETGAAAYGKFENAGAMPAGSVLAKDSFVAAPDGKLSVGPLFLMEKMASGFNEASGDWRYTLIGPDGKLMGTTGGTGSKSVEFCAECHVAGDADYMFFMPEEVRLEPN